MPQRSAENPYYPHAVSLSFLAEEGLMAAAKRVTIKGSGSEKPVSFSKGGLHRSLGVPVGERIPASKLAAAKRGEFGPKAKKQANMATGMLAAGRRTAAKNRGK